MSRARILGDRDVLVQVGSDINLTCRAEESPDAPESVIWYKNDIRVDNLLVRGGISVVTESRRRSSNLLVSKVTKDDAGNYTCVPTNAKADSVMVHVIDGKLHKAKAAKYEATARVIKPIMIPKQNTTLCSLIRFILYRSRSSSQHDGQISARNFSF